jgi:hypothetical protein
MAITNKAGKKHEMSIGFCFMFLLYPVGAYLAMAIEPFVIKVLQFFLLI